MNVIVIPGMPRIAGRRYHIAKTLAEQGHNVHYLVWDLPYRLGFSQIITHLRTTLLAKEYPYEGFTVHKIRRLPFFWPYINGWLFKYQLRKLNNSVKADFIFSQSYTNETEVPKDLPLIYDLNDDNVAMAEVYGSLIYKLAFRILRVRTVIRRQCQNALAVTAVSEATYAIGKQYNKRVFKLANGVDTKVIKEVINSKSTYPKNKFSIVYVTGFNQWSRPIETMQVVMKLRKEFPSIELALIGEGTETKKIEEFIKGNKVENYIHYLGGIYNRKKLFSLINQSTIGLNISEKNKYRDAAQPIKIFEYSALGKKIVSTDLEEVKILDFPNVFIFSDNTGSNNLLNAMRLALKDDSTYEDISSRVIANYDWVKLSRELVTIFKESI